MPLKPVFLLHLFTCTRLLWLTAHSLAFEDSLGEEEDSFRRPRGLIPASSGSGLLLVLPLRDHLSLSAQEWMLRYQVLLLQRRGIALIGARLHVGGRQADIEVELSAERTHYLTARLLPRIREILSHAHPPMTETRCAHCPACPFEEYCHVREAA